MTEKKKRTSSRIRQAARRRMELTGEKYTAALMAVRNETLRPENPETADHADPDGS